MSLSVCPATIVAAPVAVAWEMAQPPHFSEWIDGEVEHLVPEGPTTVGQTIYVTSQAFGRKWPANLTVEMVNPEKHQLSLSCTFPFGIQSHQLLSCTAIDATTCRIQYG